jgi:glutamate-1-semialdehyde 2,1-aminomutase
MSNPYPDERSKSAALAQRAQAVLPGGNTRDTIYFAPYPIYAASGQGYWLTDVDGRRYVDCINNMSSLLHGHCHPAIVEAITDQVRRLSSVASPTESEIRLAELLGERVTSVERIRFTNSGTEAVMLACRAARAYTGRPKIAKLEGAYHGGYDAVSLSVRSGPPGWGEASQPNAVPDSGGVPPGVVAETVILPGNDVGNTVRLIETHARELAAVIVDPVVPRMGFLTLEPDYLTAVREVTKRHGIVLVFDEVFSFRLGYRGRQGDLGIRPDLTTFGKIIGGGLPVGALGGAVEIMQVFDPTRGAPKVGHGGTFNGNPLTMVAGLTAMEQWTEAAVNRLNGLGERLRAGLRKALLARGVVGQVQGQGSLSALVFADRAVRNHRELTAALDRTGGIATTRRLQRRLLSAGVLTSPSGWLILSTPMDESVVDRVVEEVSAALVGVGESVQTA